MWINPFVHRAWATSAFADCCVTVLIQTTWKVYEPVTSLLVSLTHHFIISIAFQGISLEAAVLSVKKESEDPNYYEYAMQGNTIS